MDELPATTIARLNRNNTRLRCALQAIADLDESEAGEPLDDAIEIARKALAMNPLEIDEYDD